MSSENYSDGPGVTKPGGGILGRFENVRTKGSCKRMVTCDAGTPAYLQHDFLKPVHLPIDRVDQDANFHGISNVNETRFHRGFHRRHKSDIQPDAARMEHEMDKEAAREQRGHESVQAARAHKAVHTFNILTGEGEGRECEYRQVGKRVVNPFGCMEAVFGEHGRDASNRIKNSKHRFFEYPATQKHVRAENLFKEGLTDTVRETAILGYGSSGTRRIRSQSAGVSDNYSHIRGLPNNQDWEKPHYGNASQITFG